MVLTVGEKIVVAASVTKHAAADGNRAWIPSAYEARLVYLRPGCRPCELGLTVK